MTSENYMSLVKTFPKSTISNPFKKRSIGKMDSHYLNIESELASIEQIEKERDLTEKEKDKKKKLYNILSAKRSRDQKKQAMKDMESKNKELHNQTIERNQEINILKRNIESLQLELINKDKIIEHLNYLIQIEKYQENNTNTAHNDFNSLSFENKELNTKIYYLQESNSELKNQVQLLQNENFELKRLLNEQTLSQDYDTGFGVGLESDWESEVQQITTDSSEVSFSPDIHSNNSDSFLQLFSISSAVFFIFAISGWISFLLFSSSNEFLSRHPSDWKRESLLNNIGYYNMTSSLGGDYFKIEKDFEFKKPLLLITEFGVTPAHLYTNSDSENRTFFFLNNFIDTRDVTKYISPSGDIITNLIYETYESIDSPLKFNFNFGKNSQQKIVQSSLDDTNIQKNEKDSQFIILIPIQHHSEENRDYVFCKQKSFTSGKLLNDIVLVRFHQAESKPS